MASRTSVNLGREGEARLAAIQDHFRSTHGLSLSISMIARRAVDSLHAELGLIPELTPTEATFLDRHLAALQRGETPTPVDCDRFANLAARHSGPLPMEQMKKTADVLRKHPEVAPELSRLDAPLEGDGDGD